jgi:hypothetical protein
MRHLHKVEGHGTLSAPESPVLSVEFYYDAFESGTMVDIRGRIISYDYRTLSMWFHNLAKLTLKTDTFSLQFCLSDEDGHFRATEGPTPLK